MSKRKFSWVDVIGVLIVVAVFAFVIGIRLLIVGGYTECFWATDVGLCMAVAGKG